MSDAQPISGLTQLSGHHPSGATEAQQEEWIQNASPALRAARMEAIVVKLVRSGRADKASRILEEVAKHKGSARTTWMAGLASLVPIAIVVVVRNPPFPGIGFGFYLIMAVAGALFFGVGYGMWRRPGSGTIHTRTFYDGRTDMSSGRASKASDGVLFMGLSLPFFTVAVVGDLLFSVPG